MTSRLKDACRDAPPAVVAVYLFGSVARGRSDRRSDVDIGVLFSRSDAAGSDEAGAFLDRLESAGARHVDLVVLNSAPSDLVHRVLRDGVLLLDREPAHRLRFEVQARNEYFDMEPVRRAYRAPRQLDRRSP